MREKPFATFGPEHFIGVRSQHGVGIPSDVCNKDEITLKVWRDKVVERQRIDDTLTVRRFKADPPTGLRDKSSRFRLFGKGIAWDTKEYTVCGIPRPENEFFLLFNRW